MIVNSAVNAVKGSLKRNTPTLTSGRILQGKQWDYRIYNSVKGDGTHISAVYKAEVIPHENVSNAPRWAFIKTASPSNPIAMENLDRERQSYLLPGVSSSACFRKMYDVISDNVENDRVHVAFEWLDTTLAELKYKPEMRTYSLIKAVLDTALNSCVILDRQNHVNTDYKTANILLSDINVSSAYAKVGDLGLVFPTGSRFEAQPFAMRAPEVFLGQACNQKSPIWAIAAMLFCWIRPGVLGVWDCPHFLINKAWSMAKIKRLFPNWDLPAPHEVERESLAAAINSAKRISREEPELQTILPFEKEIRQVEIPDQLIRLLTLMLVLDPENRPSASHVLESEQFQDFSELVRS